MDNESIASVDAEEERKKTQECRKLKKHNVECVTKDETEEITEMHDKSRPERLECRSEEERCIGEECKYLQGCMLELATEIEKNRTNQCCNGMLNSMHVNEMKYHKI